MIQQFELHVSQPMQTLLYCFKAVLAMPELKSLNIITKYNTWAFLVHHLVDILEAAYPRKFLGTIEMLTIKASSLYGSNNDFDCLAYMMESKYSNLHTLRMVLQGTTDSQDGLLSNSLGQN